VSYISFAFLSVLHPSFVFKGKPSPHHLISCLSQLVCELRSTGRLQNDAVDPFLPLSPTRQSQVLVHIHRLDLSNLQSQHDKFLLEQIALVQRQTSGRLAHRTTADKRNHDKLLRSVRSKRLNLINKMVPHITFLQSIPGDQTVPAELPKDWVTSAREGSPFWLAGDNVVPVDCPSSKEIESIVESFLKKSRAWEQLSSVVPREVHDALEHLSLLELQARSCNDAIVRDLHHLSGASDTCHPSEFEVHLGRLVHVSDLLTTVEASRKDCAITWSIIHDLVETSPKVLEVTDPSTCRFPIVASPPFLSHSLHPPPSQLSQQSLGLSVTQAGLGGDADSDDNRTV